MRNHSVGRRAFLAGSAATAVATAGGAANAATSTAPDAEFQFAVTKSDADWKAQLDEEQFYILREAGTEFPTSSPYWNTNDAGIYHCVGCQQALYSSADYSAQEIGFVFFDHSLPLSVILSKHSTDYNGAFPEPRDYLESVCSRCGGHLGHIVVIDGKSLHCINGTVLELKKASA